MEEQSKPENSSAERQSSDPGISRKDFIRRVLKRGALAGALLAAPRIVDRFVVPPAKAATIYTMMMMD